MNSTTKPATDKIQNLIMTEDGTSVKKWDRIITQKSLKDQTCKLRTTAAELLIFSNQPY